MTIPYVRTDDKLHLSANTLNMIADHINNAPSISAGKPIKGGGGGGAPTPIVEDNTPDIFKAKNNTTTLQIDVSGGRVINGNSNIPCSGVSLNYPVNNNLFYVVLTVTYSSNAYSASIGTSTSEIYPVALTATYTLMLAKVENVNGEIIITNLRYPSPVYVNGRWG